MDKRDTIVAKLALALGLVDEQGLRRAMALKARAPTVPLDQVLLKGGLIDTAGLQRLAAAFRQRVAQAGAAAPPPPAPTPLGPPPGAESSDALLEGSSEDLIIPADSPESSDELVFPAELTGSDDGLEVPGDELDLPPDELDPGERHHTMVLQDAEGPAPGEGIYAEATVVLQPDSSASAAPEGIYEESTMVLQDSAASAPGAAAPSPPRKAMGESSAELEIDVRLASSGRTTPGSRPGGAAGGPLDRDVFQQLLKQRKGFKGYSVGDYKILGELARGAFGVVLEVEPDGVAKSMARERGYQGTLALKLMLGNSADPHGTERFLEEVRVLIGLDHPHIVRIFDAGVEAGMTYFSMELVRGTEAREHVQKQGPMPPLLAVRVAKEIASALSYVHAQRVYHRDLKPQNIMLDMTTQPYRSLLIDFGLVTDASSRDKGLILGTPSYMPPEQAQPRGGHGEVNATSDLYALGASLYFLLTGKPPFSGKDPRKIIQQVISEKPPDPLELNAEIPRRIGDITLKLLEKKQRDRYHSARELEADLDKELRRGRTVLKARSILGKFLGRKKD